LGDAVDEAPGKADLHGLAPVVLDRDVEDEAVGDDLDAIAVALDHAGLVGGALLRGGENVFAGDLAVGPVLVPAPVDVEGNERSEARDGHDRDRETHMLAGAPFVLLDLDAVALDLVELLRRALP